MLSPRKCFATPAWCPFTKDCDVGSNTRYLLSSARALFEEQLKALHDPVALSLVIYCHVDIHLIGSGIQDECLHGLTRVEVVSQDFRPREVLDVRVRIRRPSDLKLLDRSRNALRIGGCVVEHQSFAFRITLHHNNGYLAPQAWVNGSV